MTDTNNKTRTWLGFIFHIIFFVPYGLWKWVKENFLDYLFSKVKYDDKGICEVKTCGYPKIWVAGFFYFRVTLLASICMHFLPRTDVACTCIVLLLPLLSMIITQFDFNSLKFTLSFWIGLGIAALMDAGIFFLTQTYFGEGVEVFKWLNAMILKVNPLMNARSMLTISFVWAIFICISTFFHVLQNRILINREKATWIFVGGSKDIPTTFGTITMKVNAEESVFAGVGNLAFRNISDQNKIDMLIEHVQGLGNPISTLLVCPWALKVKKAIKTLNSDRTLGDN